MLRPAMERPLARLKGLSVWQTALSLASYNSTDFLHWVLFHYCRMTFPIIIDMLAVIVTIGNAAAVHTCQTLRLR